ncbi:GNAT family protein [soil metagenome]
MLTITLAHPDHAAALLAFESENRLHFEQWIASRGEHFYQLEQVHASLQQAQAAAHAGEPKEYHYLVWLGDEIVGRVALRGIEREHYFKASIGYRFSGRHGGKGYASMAVNAVAESGFLNLGLQRIEAVVIMDNRPSQTIMRKCGFSQYGHSRASVLRHGQWLDTLLFERHAGPASEATQQSNPIAVLTPTPK